MLVIDSLGTFDKVKEMILQATDHTGVEIGTAKIL